MLSKIATKNYRNLNLEQGITFNALNIFVGPNGVGKTNLTRILRFFQDVILGVPDARRGVNSFEDALATFGAGRILDRVIQMPAVVTLRLFFSADHGELFCLDIGLAIRDEQTITIKSEEFSYTTEADPRQTPNYLYRAHVPDIGRATIAVLSEDEVGELTIENVPTNQLAFDTMWNILRPDDLRARAPEYFARFYESVSQNLWPFYLGYQNLYDHLLSCRFYESSNMNLQAIRRAKPELGPSDTALSQSGDNLLLVLHNLIRDEVDFEDRMTEAMRELFPKTKRLRVLPIGRVSLQMEWYVNGLKKPFYLDEMSDGTVRMLCWATVLLSPKRHKLIVIDEPEAGVHPAWLRVLAGWIREASRESQVFISTHSSDLLDYFTEDAANVRVFKPAPDGHGNIVEPLDTDKLAEKLSEGWQLGDLYRVGDPSVGGWPW